MPNTKDFHKINGLDPVFKSKVIKLLKILEEKGYPIRIVWGRRTKEENDALVKKGSAIPNSKHLDGKALDLVHRVHGYKINTGNREFWKDLAKEAKKLGLIWGGDFSRFDGCHIEMK